MENPEISGIYPHLATFNEEGECGTGAVVPWADRLWVISYAPHKPTGSTDKLYEITPSLEQIIRSESIGVINRKPAHKVLGTYALINVLLCAVVVMKLGWPASPSSPPMDSCGGNSVVPQE